MRDEKWLRTELNKIIRELRQSANEDSREAHDERGERAAALRRGADAFRHAAGEIERALRGDTSAEDLAKSVGGKA